MLFHPREVREIRQMYQSGFSRGYIAKQFKAPYACICNIVLNRTYFDPAFEPEFRSKLDVDFAADLRAQGKSYAEIAWLEKQHTGRARPYCGETIRRQLTLRSQHENKQASE